MNKIKLNFFLIFINLYFISTSYGEHFFYKSEQQIALPTNEKYRICFLGDTGTGSDRQFLISEELLKQNCNQVRILGDLIYPSGLNRIQDNQFLTKFYLPYKKFLEGDSINGNKKIPFYLTVGNHDYFRDPHIWVLQSRKNPLINIPSLYYAEQWNDVCFITLDTQEFYNHTVLSSTLPKQINWYERAMDLLKPTCKFSIVMGHHPYLSTGMHGNAGGTFHDFFKEQVLGKVDLYMAGHDHQLSDEGLHLETRLLISGAGAKTRETIKTNVGLFSAEKLGFIVLEFSEQKEKNNNSLNATYFIYSIDEKTKTTTLNFQNSITGQGIRPK